MAGILRYEKELRRQVRDSDHWPDFSAPRFLDRLDASAYAAFHRGRREGDLAATLIYHQLVEEMLRLLIRDCQFFIKLSVFPARIALRIPAKQTFGQLLQLLSDSIEFPKKKQLLQRAGQLNSLRIEVVHRLVSRGSLAGLRRLAGRAQRLYEDCYRLFDTAHDHFRVCFKDFRKDVFEEVGPARSNKHLQPAAGRKMSRRG